MRRILVWALVATLSASAALGGATPGASNTVKHPAKHKRFHKTFHVDPKDFSSIGKNTYFILDPGYVLSFARKAGGKEATLVITVLSETKTIAGVEVRVVEERETRAGQVAEVSRNYYAISKRTNDVYYFGEDVDVYRDGKVVGHEGSWTAGQAGNRYGLAMPGVPKRGARYYQEIAPKIAMDRAEIVSLNRTMTTPAGKFDKVLKVRESSPLEPGVKEYKYYAPGVGLIRDGRLRLVKYGRETGR